MLLMLVLTEGNMCLHFRLCILNVMPDRCKVRYFKKCILGSSFPGQKSIDAICASVQGHYILKHFCQDIDRLRFILKTF